MAVVQCGWPVPTPRVRAAFALSDSRVTSPRGLCQTTPGKFHERLSSVSDMEYTQNFDEKSACELFSECLSLQRIDLRLSLLQTAVDEYNKAKNDFAAKVSLF